MTPFDSITLLRTFLKIVDCGGISAAARSLRVPQPTLSRQLKQLEERCGLPLLRRDTHRMRLTEAGHRLREDALAMIELADGATLRLHEQRAKVTGHLRLFSTVDGGQFFFTRLIAEFLNKNPGVTAELGYTNRPVRLIDEGFDAGMLVGRITDDRLIALPAGEVIRYPVAAPELVERLGSPKNPQDLKTWPWLSLAGPQFGDPGRVPLVHTRRGKTELMVQTVFRGEGATSLREMARMGVGVAVLPEWLIGDDVRQGRLVRVLPEWSGVPLPVWVIHPGDRRVPARVRAFVDFAVEYLRTFWGGTGAG
jgi:DNA-binding transcriptional LysR family regulator